MSADPDVDRIEIDGRPLKSPQPFRYILLNKPLGVVSTVKDRHALRTVIDLLEGVPERVYPVGRLDAETAGLLLLTNDGAFAAGMTHPRHRVAKTYRVLVRERLEESKLQQLRDGVELSDGVTLPAKVEVVSFERAHNTTVLDITITEGRNRQIRRMIEAIGHRVLALTRTAIGPLELKNLAPGKWRPLHPRELKLLREAILPPQPKPATKAKPAETPSPAAAAMRLPAGAQPPRKPKVRRTPPPGSRPPK